ETTADELASLMVGRSISFKTEKEEASPKRVVLKVDGVHINDSRNVPVVKGMNLEVRAGEIVGIAGIDGNGQREVIEAIAGLKKTESGSIYLNDEPIANLPPRKITEKGLAHIPQDRQKFGLVLDFPVNENVVLQTYYKPPYSKNNILKYDKINEFA